MFKRNIIRDVLILFAFSLIPVFWFKPGCFIAGGDVAQYLDVSNLMRFFPWAWDERIAAGEPCMHTTFSLPYGYFWLLFKKLGFHLITVEKAWVFCTFFASAVSMYVFVRGFLRDKSGIAPLFSAVLYVFNLFLIVAPLIIQYNLAPLYMFGPLTLSFWGRGLSAGTVRNKCGCAGGCAVSSLLYANANVNLPHVAAFWVIILLYAAYHFLFISSRKTRDVLFIIGTLVLYGLINIWWVVSSFLAMVHVSDVMQGTRSGWNLLQATHLSDAFRFLGFWAWTHTHNAVPYFPFHEQYQTWLLLLLSYGAVFFALCAVFLRKKEALFPLMTLVAGLFLVKGSTGPLGFVYEFFWKNVHGCWVFREPWSKFTHINVFAVSVLFGIAVSEVWRRCKAWSPRSRPAALIAARVKTPFLIIYPVVMVIGVLVAAYPSVTGAVIWDQYNNNMRSMQVKVPEYWPRLGAWFRERDPHARVFILPRTGYASAPYDWESGFMAATTAAISYLPNQLAYATDFPTTRAHELFNGLFAFFEKDNSEDMSGVLKMLGVAYVLQQNDISWKFASPGTLSPAEMMNVLRARPELVLKQRFGKLDLYEVRDPGSLFSVSTDVRIFVGSNIDMYAVAGKGMLDKPYLAADSLEEASTIANKATRCEVIDWNKAVRGDDAGKIDALDPVVIRDVRRIHPGKYIVGVSAKTPFWLVCNETYNPGWEARATDGPGTAWRDRIIERSTLLCRVFQAGRNPVMETHARLNDYANGWFIGRTGDFSIVVEYGPQGIYELAKLVSWCCGLLCLLFMSRAFFVR
jgi:arabinofuranan 3-O-arabinosyltransferase